MNKSHVNVFALLFLLGAIIISACGAPAMQEAPQAYIEEFAAATEAPASIEQSSVENQDSGLPADVFYETGVDSPIASTHLIIKSADIKLLVADSDQAIDRATQIVGDTGGYIISSRIWYQSHYDGENYKYATITIGVPVQQFERALTRLRGLAVQVLDETASGEDVTDQYVDLQSQLTNLEATRERIKSFLDSATTVDEALRINTELTEIERQIEEIKGRVNYLQDRSAYSTITINFEPQLPEIIYIPTPEPNPWTPSETFENAKKSVTRAYQNITDILIWFLVVLVPIFAPPLLIIWLVLKFILRKSKKPSS